VGIRDVLLIGLVLGGLAALGAALYPATASSRAANPPASAAEPVALPAVVEEVNDAWRRQWAEAGIEPAPRASDLAVARRLSLALTGTIPSLQEVRQLEAWPPRERQARWLETIFQDRRSADYLAERLARVFAGTEDGPFLVYRRRRFVSWLSDQLRDNRPYDDIVREMIAGTGLWTDHPATNFVTVTFDDAKKEPNPERLAGRVARAFLGIRLDCAQCHNHPFEKWKQADFQGLAAFFGQVRQGFTGIYDGDGELEIENRKTGILETIPPRVPFQPELLEQDGTRREQLARWVTDRRNPAFAQATVNRAWGLMFGRPLIEPVDAVSSSPEAPRALKILADDFASHGYDLRRLIGNIAATEVFQLDSAGPQEITDAHEKAWAAFPVTRLRAEQVVGSILQASSLETVNADSHILSRIVRYFNEKDFIERYGDNGDDELDGRGGTIPQRLLTMNGAIVKDRTTDNLFNAATRIAALAPDDQRAVETAYLAVLTRRPTPDEAAHFEGRLAGTQGTERRERLEDLYWTLINSSESAWNH
jgi:hypothetical protein